MQRYRAEMFNSVSKKELESSCYRTNARPHKAAALHS